MRRPPAAPPPPAPTPAENLRSERWAPGESSLLLAKVPTSADHALLQARPIFLSTSESLLHLYTCARAGPSRSKLASRQAQASLVSAIRARKAAATGGGSGGRRLRVELMPPGLSNLMTAR